MTHRCISKLTTIDSDNGWLPGQCQAIIWISTGILLIGTLGTNFIEIVIETKTFSWRKCIWKCHLWNIVLGLNVLSLKKTFSFYCTTSLWCIPSEMSAILHEPDHVPFLGYVLTASFLKCHTQTLTTYSHHHTAYWAFNSLWPYDGIWQHRSGSTLAHVMACCLMAPSHYLNQCWLIISKIQLH